VVSYDIKYGPREQIEDGVNGFLVPPRDTAAMAERVIELLTSPDLSARISVAAVERASSSKTRFVQDWQHILETVVDRKPRRTKLRQVTLDIETLRVDPAGSRPRLNRGRGSSFVHASGGPGATLRFAGKLAVDGRAHGTHLGDAELTLSAVHAASGSLTDLPLRVRRHDSLFILETEVEMAQVVADAPTGAEVSLRLLLVWGNAAWQTQLSRPKGGGATYDVSYDRQDRFQVRARP
jgi:poly(glycerol-phosphate) alpha-glucosyltransferase